MSSTTTATRPRATSSPGWWRTSAGQRMASVLLGLFLLAAWDLSVRTGMVDKIILPHPQDVTVSLIEQVQTSSFWNHFRVTTIETLASFVIGSAVGFALGAMLGSSGWLRAVTFPYVVAFQGLPKVVLAPVFITALGFGMGSKIAMGVVLAFFPVLLNTMVGILSVDRDQARVMQLYRANAWQRFTKLTLPSAAPMISAGFKASLTFSLIGAIVGEFVGASEGLGYLLNSYAYRLQVPEVWAVMVVLAVMGVVLYALIELVDRKLIFWTREGGTPPTA